ncbi:MAG: hypothetical protein EXS63_04625 [Candidatus Omnitrophica bacterium]|nr:hypothetical protein [Candidatus Omnitrophota bacterium]
MNLKYSLEYRLAQIIAFLLNSMPVGLSSKIVCLLSRLAGLVLPSRKKIALVNLDRVFGSSLTQLQKEKILGAAFESMSLAMLELFIVRKIKKNARSHFKLTGNEHLEKAFAEGKGVILVISHLGSWEYLAFLPYLTGHPWSVIVKDVKNPYLNQTIDQLRREMTVTPIPKVDSIKAVMKELRANHGVAILIDQWAGGEGIWTNFFDQPTSTTSIPARLAHKTGAALVPACCLRTSTGQYEIQIEPTVPFDPAKDDWEISMTEQLNQLLEEKIRRHPDQWIWNHRRWKSKPAYTREPN